MLILGSCNEIERKFIQGSTTYPGADSGEVFLTLTYADAYIDTTTGELGFKSYEHLIDNERIKGLGYPSKRIGDTANAYNAYGKIESGMRPLYVNKEEYEKSMKD